jgi:GTPase SAR1 family protein
MIFLGKSSLLHRIASSKFDDTYTTTIGVDFKTIKISNGDKEIPIQLWDTAGQ